MIAFTCYPATDLWRASRSYEDRLGWKRACMFGREDKGSIECASDLNVRARLLV